MVKSMLAMLLLAMALRLNADVTATARTFQLTKTWQTAILTCTGATAYRVQVVNCGVPVQVAEEFAGNTRTPEEKPSRHRGGSRADCAFTVMPSLFSKDVLLSFRSISNTGQLTITRVEK